MDFWGGFFSNSGFFKIFGSFFVLSSAKKIRHRTFYDPQGGHIVQYRNLRHPSPPKKVRRLLWTAPRSSKSAKNFRRRIFHDPWGGHIVKYRNLSPPSPPKKVRRLLWTAPNVKLKLENLRHQKIILKSTDLIESGKVQSCA